MAVHTDPDGIPERRERQAIEHEFRSPAGPLDGFSLVHCVELEGGRLLEVWLLLGQGVVFRECIRDEPRGWVPYTQSAVTIQGNVWTNDPALDRVTLEASPIQQKT
jgi:hypothetical protein